MLVGARILIKKEMLWNKHLPRRFNFSSLTDIV